MSWDVISLRIPEEMGEDLDRMVDLGEWEHRSDLIRASIEQTIEEQGN